MTMNNDNNALDSVPARVAHAIINSDLSATDIAFKMGVRESTIWRWKKLGKSNFKDREVHRLAKITGYSADWILYNEGEMFANGRLNRIKSVRDVQDSGYKGRDQIVLTVARKLKSLAQEFVILAESLEESGE